MTHKLKRKGKLLLKLFSLPLFRETLRCPADPEISRKRVDGGTQAKGLIGGRIHLSAGPASKGGCSVRMTQEKRSRVGRSTVADVIPLTTFFGKMKRGIDR
ncbi:hypothetical protein TNCT_271521 [Trichonephila clavata]|uniref:Uncharacterized protein n=1 Tax=Trichonephila clavata TaxID=2740835 RepID=A0A8X6JP04_TRICU|nr:hypothetical protein TNCT_271521 [Trichonephila clavata]